MKNYKLLTTLPLLLLQAGCSEFYGYQPPAPIYDSAVTNPYEVEAFRTYPDVTVEERAESMKIQEIGKQEALPSLDNKAAYPAQTLSPAVIALMTESERNQRAGDLDSAVVVLERALRIDPRNPTLTYKLAELRMKQEKPRLAEDLAKKAALLAAGNVDLKRRSWLLISEARRMQQNFQGAKEAKMKAQSFVNP